MQISFRYRKTGRNIDSSYYLTSEFANEWVVGDVVGVCFPDVDKSIVDITNREGVIRDYLNPYFLQIRCKVVSRHHSIVWKSVGKFEQLPSGAVLEAESGELEDLLLWIILDVKPEWAQGE